MFTPQPLAALLANMFDQLQGRVRILDPGAGVGSLIAAVVERAAAEKWDIDAELSAVEIDPALAPPLQATLAECGQVLGSAVLRVVSADFIEWGCDQIRGGGGACYDLAILNPPYAKLRSRSIESSLLVAAGIRTPNLYAAFVGVCLRLLRSGGQLVAIIPRSFVNGLYFRAFRAELLNMAAVRQVHIFEARDQAFRDSGVLQENVVVHLVKGEAQQDVTLTTSWDPTSPRSSRRVPFSRVVHPDDPDRFIRLVGDGDSDVAEQMWALPGTLPRLGLSVSTGRVVAFRARQYLRPRPERGTVPLLHPLHLREGRVRWPAPTSSRKSNALVLNDSTQRLTHPSGNYVLVKRFSSKEQPRRIFAAVLTADDLPSGSAVAIENHVNVFHLRNGPLPLDLAWGIATWLNSTAVDTFFRQWSGSTQVNATDLRSLHYPSADQLVAIGAEAARRADMTQQGIDASVIRHFPELAGI